MLFHITAQHDHLSCGGVQSRREGKQAEFQREGGVGWKVLTKSKS